MSVSRSTATICAPTVLPRRFSDRAARIAAGRRKRQLHLEARRVLDDVRVGHDVAVGVDDDPGGARPLHRRLCRRRFLFVRSRVAGHEDLDDARADDRGKILKRSWRSARVLRLRFCAAGACAAAPPRRRPRMSCECRQHENERNPETDRRATQVRWSRTAVQSWRSHRVSAEHSTGLGARG